MAGWLIDKTPLDSPEQGWIVDGTSGIPVPAQRAAELVEVPFADGAIPVAGGMQTTILAIRVFVESGRERSYDLLMDRMARLVRLVQDGEWLVWERDGRGLTGVDRELRCARILRTVISEPERAGWSGAFVEVEFTLAPYWRSEGNYGDSFEPASSAKETHTIQVFKGTTAPVVDATVKVNGPATRVELTSGNTGITVTKTIPVKKELMIDCEHRTVTQDHKPVPFDYPAGGFLQIQPSPDGAAPVIQSTIAGYSKNTYVDIRGHKWYL